MMLAGRFHGSHTRMGMGSYQRPITLPRLTETPDDRQHTGSAAPFPRYLNGIGDGPKPKSHRKNSHAIPGERKNIVLHPFL